MVALFRLRLPRLLRQLAPRLTALLRPIDYAWLIAAGIALPYGYAMGVIRGTPLGGREWGIMGNHGLLPMVQFLCMVMLMLVLPVLVARWRVAKRAGCLGLVGGMPWFGWLAVLCSAAGIPLSGWIAPVACHRDAWQPVLIGLAAVPVLWLIVTSLRAVCGSTSLRLLTGGVIACALVPVYAVAMLLMAIAAPCHEAAEQYWFQRDTLMRPDPAYPAMSPFEYRATRQLRGEIRRILGLDQ